MTELDLEARLKELGPIQKVSLCQIVVERLSGDMDALREAEGHVALEVRNSDGFKWLVEQANEDPSSALDENKSEEIAEIFLLAAARDPELSMLVKSELDSFQDDRQFVLATLAVGFAVSMIIVAATSSFHYQGDKMTISKTTASPDLVKAAASIAMVAPT